MTKLIDLEPLRMALQALEAVLVMPDHKIPHDILRDSGIQRFEFSFELTWKTLRRYMSIYFGKSEKHTRAVLKLAFEMKLIDDIKIWDVFLEARNLSSHEYGVEISEKIFATAKVFLPLGKEALKRMEEGLA
ncbi:MAG: hypothetical protein EB059_01195 [Alphaproteobacteria bacterium]|nr:hypothetical protein [Alphaproteobacteria bacterium]